MTPYETHMAAIKAQAVTRANVAGIRRLLNADARRDWGIQPRVDVTPDQIGALHAALSNYRPRVASALYDSGLTLLRQHRWRMRLAAVQHMLAQITEFRLVGFDMLGRHAANAVPVYEARTGEQGFTFRTIPWQSGGDGPELLSGPYALTGGEP